jgi:hypothetical protein
VKKGTLFSCAGVTAEGGQELIGVLRYMQWIVAGRSGDLASEMIKTVSVHFDLAIWRGSLGIVRSFLKVQDSDLC